jgi:hypothetical protein
MHLSPGEHRSRKPSLLRILALLVPALGALWVWNTRYPPVREYRLYLTENRPNADLPWHAITESWTEADVKRHFQGSLVRCVPDETGIPGVTRLCVADIRALNGVPTMTVHFLFSGEKLSRVASNIPWWSHESGYEALVTTYGAPHASQEVPHSDVRLHGWRLVGGGALFYNREPPRNPLSTNSIQWSSPSACRQTGCIR